MKLTRISLASFAALALLASPVALGPALAQQQPEAQPVPAPTPGAQQFDEDKLRSFAVAYLEVSKVAQQYQPQLQATTDPQEQKRIQTEATNNMVQVVERAEGITVEEYNTIASNAQSDPALAQQINTLVQEAAGSGQ
jgi:hypothetical protein